MDIQLLKSGVSARVWVNHESLHHINGQYVSRVSRPVSDWLMLSDRATSGARDLVYP